MTMILYVTTTFLMYCNTERSMMMKNKILTAAAIIGMIVMIIAPIIAFTIVVNQAYSCEYYTKEEIK